MRLKRSNLLPGLLLTTRLFANDEPGKCFVGADKNKGGKIGNFQNWVVEMPGDLCTDLRKIGSDQGRIERCYTGLHRSFFNPKGKGRAASPSTSLSSTIFG